MPIDGADPKGRSVRMAIPPCNAMFPPADVLPKFDETECQLGGVAEWSMAAVLKTAVGVTQPGVRIPPPPRHQDASANDACQKERQFMTQQVESILANYAGETPGVLGNLRRLLQHGRLAGTGKMVILPVDQGFEHGPARSFAPNPAGYDPEYHVQLAIESGCNAYAAPLGAIEAVASRHAGVIPLILKVNNSDSMGGPAQPCSALTSSVQDAVRLGCSAIGFTIYPGSGERNVMYQQIRDLIREARNVGLPTVLWAYARGENLDSKAETAVDIIAYAAHVACQLGAHVVKVKPPTSAIGLEAARSSYKNIPVETLEDRIKHVVNSSFAGKRMVIFSGGPSKGTEDVLEEIRGLAKGGAFGSIMGRNAFQRPRADAVKLLQDAMEIFRNEGKA